MANHLGKLLLLTLLHVGAPPAPRAADTDANQATSAGNLTAIEPPVGAVVPRSPASGLLDPEHWRREAIDGLIPLWYDHVRDREHGGFYLNLARDWTPVGPWEKMPAMISRDVFGFTAAYLMSGEDRYLDVASEGVDYLIEHAWDREYGGWFGMLDQNGDPVKTRKEIAEQLYTNVGLALYYFATGDDSVLSFVEKSIEIQRTHGHDPEFGGYYQTLNRDLSVEHDGKNKHAHFGYVSSLLLNLYMATRDPDILAWERELTDLTLERMVDPVSGWVGGFQDRFDRHWVHSPAMVDGRDVVNIGGQMTAALSLLRIYHQAGDSRYLQSGVALGDSINRYGFDPEAGAWIQTVERAHPHARVGTPSISWWIQIYGSFLQLQLYRLTHDPACLTRFEKGEAFWESYFMDREYGGAHKGVNLEGKPSGSDMKARGWQAAYHEMEHCLLNYLYLNLYVNNTPAVLHFRFKGVDRAAKRYVSLMDDPSVMIGSVTVDGRAWPEFDAVERSVSLPTGTGFKVVVTLTPAAR